MILGKLLEDYRLRYGLKGTEFAKMIKITPEQLWQISSQTKMPIEIESNVWKWLTKSEQEVGYEVQAVLRDRS